MTRFVVHSEKELHCWGGRKTGSRSVCTSLIWGESMGVGWMYCEAFGLDVLEDSDLKIK